MKIVWGRSIGFNMSFNGIGNANPSPGNVYMEQTIITDGADCYPWHEVYAWWPVKTIAGKRMWLERVYKRRVWVVWGTGFHMEPKNQYATLFDVLAEIGG